VDLVVYMQTGTQTESQKDRGETEADLFKVDIDSYRRPMRRQLVLISASSVNLYEDTVIEMTYLVLPYLCVIML
jgi:hypothetical protein